MLAAYFMHMGFYENAYYSIGDNMLEEVANFSGYEYDENGNYSQNESGDIYINTTIRIDGVETNEKLTFKEYEDRIAEYTKGSYESIDIPLTAENIDKYIK